MKGLAIESGRNPILYIYKGIYQSRIRLRHELEFSITRLFHFLIHSIEGMAEDVSERVAGAGTDASREYRVSLA